MTTKVVTTCYSIPNYVSPTSQVLYTMLYFSDKTIRFREDDLTLSLWAINNEMLT